MQKVLSIREKNTTLFIRLAGVLVLICVICVAGLFANPFRFLFPPVPISDEMKNFTLEQDKIEFLYPANWFAHATPQGNHGDMDVIAGISAPVPNFQNIIVARKSLDSATIADVAEWGVLRIKTRILHYKLNPVATYSSELFLGSIREYIVYSTSPIATQNAHCKDLYFLHEQNGYAFTFCANESDWDEVSPVFDKIIASIKFLEK